MIFYILDAKIVEITNLSPTVKGYKLAVKDGNDTTFMAGQWVDFFIPTVGIVLDFFHIQNCCFFIITYFDCTNFRYGWRI